MREIKFRAWDKQNNVMCDVELLGESVLKIKGGEWENREDFIIMQVSGLKDKHGREIYEGDIIRITHHGENGTYAVRYYGDKDYPAFDTDPYYDYDYNGLSYATDMGAVEAIGNIYENPELLEAGDGP